MRGFHTVTCEFILLSGPLAPCLCSFIPILHKKSDDSIYFKVVVILIWVGLFWAAVLTASPLVCLVRRLPRWQTFPSNHYLFFVFMVFPNNQIYVGMYIRLHILHKYLKHKMEVWKWLGGCFFQVEYTAPGWSICLLRCFNIDFVSKLQSNHDDNWIWGTLTFDGLPKNVKAFNSQSCYKHRNWLLKPALMQSSDTTLSLPLSPSLSLSSTVQGLQSLWWFHGS